MKHTFFGGVHPSGGKELSLASAIRPVEPRWVAIPLLQHIGAACRCVVSVGDSVSLGDVIGVPTGLGAAIHASVSGTVRTIEERPHVGGALVESVVIENDFCGHTRLLPPLTDRSGETVMQRIAEAGIVGMGGAAFPTAVKVQGAVGKADTLIANGCECEPYITADDVLLTTVPRNSSLLSRNSYSTLALRRLICSIASRPPRSFSHLNTLPQI